jgi:N-succinyl-L-ornithine transcarbamylase
MKKFTSAKDILDISALTDEALAFKKDPWSGQERGIRKTLGLIFMNPSLRTRISTHKAATNLGMEVMVLNVDKDGWALEFEEGAIMNGSRVEHVKDAAAVMGKYCDIIGLRCFPGLMNREEDYSETILNQFIRYAGVPVISLESATLHPLQSLADLITIRETWHDLQRKPRVVLTWAPHIKALPQAVANSFAEWMLAAGMDLTITHPKGMELHQAFTSGARIVNDQEKALQDADYIYVKNWSSYEDYGKTIHQPDWMLSEEKLLHAGLGKIMHCLPVRRNVELSDELLDSPRSLIISQADNRVWAAQAVLNRILCNL